MLYRIRFKIDSDERLTDYEFVRDSCSQPALGQTAFKRFCLSLPLIQIIHLSFGDLVEKLKIDNEEQQFLLYTEWDCLRCALTQYLGLMICDLDAERCQIVSVEHHADGVTVEEVVFPPKK